MSVCRSCGAEVVWVATERGKKMPLDADPYFGDDPRGLFVIRFDEGKPFALATTPDAFGGEARYRSHFATCPQAEEWRK